MQVENDDRKLIIHAKRNCGRIHDLQTALVERFGLKAAFVVADIIGLNGHDAWRKKISDETGIPVSGILFGDVHNHAAPMAGPEMATAWQRRFGQALLKAAREAAEAAAKAASKPAALATAT